MDHRRNIAARTLVALCMLSGAAVAGELEVRHARLAPALADNPFGMPMHVESRSEGNAHEGDVLGVLNAPYDAVRAMALSSAGWCAVATLHPNVKACIEAATGDTGECALEFYVGRREYEDPAFARRTRFDFRIEERGVRALGVQLVAARGPYGTRDYHIALEAEPLDAHRTVVRLRYGYVAGFEARFASGLYFATAGRDKVGFTEVDTAEGSQPVRGVRGAIERNAVRYFLALQAHLESDATLDDRLTRWMTLRDRFPRQLESLDRSAYVDAKRREHQEERALRAVSGAGCTGADRQAASGAATPSG